MKHRRTLLLESDLFHLARISRCFSRVEHFILELPHVRVVRLAEEDETREEPSEDLFLKINDTFAHLVLSTNFMELVDLVQQPRHGEKL